MTESQRAVNVELLSEFPKERLARSQPPVSEYVRLRNLLVPLYFKYFINYSGCPTPLLTKRALTSSRRLIHTSP